MINRIKTYITKHANAIVFRSRWYNDFWCGATKFWSINEFGLDVVNLGSGAGVHAFNYRDNIIKGQNWALGPQSLAHDFNILKNYFSYIREDGYVLITICPFSSMVVNYSKQHNFKYYTFLHPATIENFEEEERSKALRLRYNPFKEMPMICLRRTIVEVVNCLFHKQKANSVDLMNSADVMIAGWKAQFGINDLSAPLSLKHQEEQQKRKQLLREMVEFCKERQLNPVIVIPPMHHTLYEKFPQIFIDNYIGAFLNGIGAPVLNCMKDRDIADDNLFATALFLNERGAEAFTYKVLQQLNLNKR